MLKEKRIPDDYMLKKMVREEKKLLDSNISVNSVSKKVKKRI